MDVYATDVNYFVSMVANELNVDSSDSAIEIVFSLLVFRMLRVFLDNYKDYFPVPKCYQLMNNLKNSQSVKSMNFG